MRVPPGGAGTVVEVRVFSRRGLEKDERARAIERSEIERLAKDRDDEQNVLEKGFASRMMSILDGQIVAAGPSSLSVNLTPICSRTVSALASIISSASLSR